MRLKLFFIALCVFLSTILSAQIKSQFKLELPTLKGQNPDSVAKMLNTPGLHWRVSDDVRTGKNPIKKDCGGRECQTQYRHPILVASLLVKKEGEDKKPDTCCPVNNYYNYENRVTNNDNRITITNNYPAQKAGFTLHGVAVSRWFAEVDMLRSTDHSFKSAFPVVRLGWQVEGYIKEAPGFKLQFETNLVGFQQDSDPNCTSCVPQEILKPNIGLQIKGTAKWQFSKRNSLSAYRKSTTVMLSKREAIALPDEGWGVELERKMGPIAVHGGWIKNSSKANTIYVGASVSAFQKSSGVKEDRGMYETPDKLYSKRSEERAARKAERKAAK